MMAWIFVFFPIDVYRAFEFETAAGGHAFGIGVGSFVILINWVMLSGYALGCHSLRHVVGGFRNVMAGRPFRARLLQLRVLPEPPAHGLGLVQPDLGHVLRHLRPPVLDGHLDRLEIGLMEQTPCEYGRAGDRRGRRRAASGDRSLGRWRVLRRDLQVAARQGSYGDGRGRHGGRDRQRGRAGQLEGPRHRHPAWRAST